MSVMIAAPQPAIEIQQPRKKKKSKGSGKYGARRVVIDDIPFASELEGRYYRHLCMLRDLGEVRCIVPHPTFEIHPGFTKNGKRYRPIHYEADFEVVYADGSTRVIDVKGDPTPIFKLKAKMYALRYDIPLICVSEIKGGKGWREWIP